MPIYKVTDPDSGKTVRLEGDSPPTEQELNEIFATIKGGNTVSSEQPQTQQPNIMDTLKKLAGTLPNVQFAQSALKAIPNVPSDIKKTFVDPILHPIDTAEGIGKLLAGGARKHVGIPGIDIAAPFGQIARATVPEEWEKYPDALIDSYIEKYGCLEKIKNTFENEPIGFLLDLSTLFTGTGAVLKSPQFGAKTAQIGKTLSSVGKATEPLHATGEVLGGALKPIKSFIRAQEGVLSGTGATNIEKGIEAVAKGGASKEAFLQAKKGKITPAQIYEESREVLGAVTKKFKSEYESKLANISKDTNVLDVSPIEQKFDNLVEKLRGKKTNDIETPFTFKGTSVTPNEEKLINDLYKRFRDDHVALAGEGGLTPLALNDFKNYVSKFYSESGIKSKSVAEIKSSINDVLKQVPEYDKMQGAYSKAIKIEDEFTQAIGNPNKRIADSAVTKLTNMLKNDREYGINFLETLEKESGTEIVAKLAGLSMKPWIPQGVMGKILAVGSSAAILGDPAMVAQMATLIGLTSPKVLGEFVRAIGNVKRYSTATKKYTPTEARLAYGQAGKMRQPQEENK